MPFSRRFLLSSTGLAFAGATLSNPARAADWQPDRSLRIIVAYVPGGSTDLMARLLADGFSRRLGQTVVVENRPGGSGVVGTETAARATPDGTTLLMATNGTHGINTGLYPDLSYDAVKDFTPISKVCAVPLVLVVPKSINVTSVVELVQLAKLRPGELNFGSAGIGSSGHLAGEMFKRMAQIDIEHVPYRGDGGAYTDLLGGRLSFMFANLPGAMQQIPSGALLPLAVTSTVRATPLPGVPTMQEAGPGLLGGFQVDPWYGLRGPAGMPPGAVERLHRETVAILAEPAVKAQMAKLGAEVVAGTPEQFAAVIRGDIERYGTVIRDAHIEAR